MRRIIPTHWIHNQANFIKFARNNQLIAIKGNNKGNEGMDGRVN